MKIKDYIAMVKSGISPEAIHREVKDMIHCSLCENERIENYIRKMKLSDYKKLVQPKEHMIQTEIINYLKAHGYYIMRLNSGKYSVGEGRQKRFIMGQEAGTPDVCAFRKGRFVSVDTGKLQVKMPSVDLLFVEVKRPGGKATLLQQHKMKELTEYGARCIIATSIEDVKKQI